MKVSVIVCTVNRAKILLLCLDSIEASLKQAEQVDAEIIVVNNASTDDTVTQVEEWCKKSMFPLRLITENKKGIAHARNCGLRAASGDLLILIDDDCRLDINHISVALQHHLNDKVPTMRGGRVDLGNPEDWPITIDTYPHTQRWHKNHPEWGPVKTGEVPGANMALPREIFETIGFYDPRFGTKEIPAGEDTDYIFRAYFAGHMIEYVPDMIVAHHHGRRDADTVKCLIRNYSIGAGALYGKYLFRHPHIHHKLFSKKFPAAKEESSEIIDERTLQIREFTKKAKIYYPLGMLRYWIQTGKGLILRDPVTK